MVSSSVASVAIMLGFLSIVTEGFLVHTSPMSLCQAAKLYGQTAQYNHLALQRDRQRRASHIFANVRAKADPTFKLNLEGDTLLVVKPLSLLTGLVIGTKTNELVAAFKTLKMAETAGEKRPILDPVSYEWTDGKSSLELECNPNLFTNAFNAKVFVLFENEDVKVCSQVTLVNLIEAIKDFKAAF